MLEMIPLNDELEALVFAKTKKTLRDFTVALGYEVRTCYRWRRDGVSRYAAAKAEVIFGGAIKAHELRPDLFSDPQKYSSNEQSHQQTPEFI